MERALSPLRRHLSDPDPSARLVRVVRLRGFGLRDAADGAVLTDGGLEGGVLGGLADDELGSAGPGRLTIRATITDAAADAGGLVCGGAAELLLSPLADLPAELGELVSTGRAFALVARSDGSGTDHVVTRELDGGLDETTVGAARDLLRAGATHSVETDDGWVIHAVVPATHLHVIGSGAMADAITGQAELLGWSATATDDLEVALDWLGTAGPADALVILSHDRAIDVPAIATALRSPLGYLGAMGSRGTQTARRNLLLADGFTEADLARIHGPVGLDLGGRRPPETAVAIAAEIIAARNGKAPGSLRDGAGSING